MCPEPGERHFLPCGEGRLGQELTSAQVPWALDWGQGDGPQCAWVKGRVGARSVPLGCEVLAGCPRGATAWAWTPGERVQGLLVPGLAALVEVAGAGESFRLQAACAAPREACPAWACTGAR